MKKKNKPAQTKSLNLALYFGLLVLFIIIITISFKVIDTVRKSKFDGQNRFTVAIFNKNSTEFVTVSPRDGSLTMLFVDKVSTDRATELALFDAYVKTKSDFNQNAKASFAKLFFSSKGKISNLTIIDYIRLILYSQGVQNDKIINDRIFLSDENNLINKTSSYFIDPIVSDEKITVQVINATGIPGLGNRYARLIGNTGANITLVNSSKEIENNSKILYKTDSYTVNKLSKILNIKKEKQVEGSISDIIIIFGRDLEEKTKTI